MRLGQRRPGVPEGKVTLNADTVACLIALSILGLVFLTTLVASLVRTTVGAVLVLALVVAWILWGEFYPGPGP